MRSEGYCSWVCQSVCVSVKSHLTYGASVRPENAVTYSAGKEGQKICGVFSETAPLQRSSTPSVVRPCVQSAIFPCVFLVYAHAYFSCIYAHDTPPRVQHFSAFITTCFCTTTGSRIQSCVLYTAYMCDNIHVRIILHMSHFCACISS